MVSLQSTLSPSPDRRKVSPDSENSSQKRKWEEPYDYKEQVFYQKRSKPHGHNFMADIELQLETPLPSDWQRCLDIQSGKIHFYNTKTHTRTSRDPRSTSPRDHHDHGHDHMSLDLELNLTTSESLRKNRGVDEYRFFELNPSTTTLSDLSIESSTKQMKKSTSSSAKCPSWLAFEADQQEMVAMVCKRCHMLVMLCRSSPSCPNCKFMHPHHEKSTTDPSTFIQVKQ